MMLDAKETDVDDAVRRVSLDARKAGISPGRYDMLKSEARDLMEEIWDDPTGDYAARFSEIASDMAVDQPATSRDRVHDAVLKGLERAASGIELTQKARLRASRVEVEDPAREDRGVSAPSTDDEEPH